MSRCLDGYPTSWGSTKASVFPHAGPTSYTQITAVAGTVPVTGGDSVQAVEAGFKYFDYVKGGITDDGAFEVEAIPVTITNIVGGPSKTYALKWLSRVTATVGGQAQVAGNEAVAGTNLSAEIVRLLAVGPK